MLSILILLSTITLIFSKVFPFDKSVIQQCFKDNNPCLFLLTNTNQQSNNAKKIYYEFAQKNDQILISHSHSQDQNTFYRKICDYLGTDYKLAPHIIYLSEKKHKYKFNESFLKNNLQKFVQKAQQGTLQIYVKSQPVLQKSEVLLDLDGNSFRKIVMNSQKQFLIKLYAPWCPHCRDMAEQFDQAAKMLGKNQNIMFAQMDYTVNQISALQIPGYPTIKFYKKDKRIDPLDYEGQRKAVDFVKWLKENTEYEWILPIQAPNKQKEQQDIDAQQDVRNLEL